MQMKDSSLAQSLNATPIFLAEVVILYVRKYQGVSYEEAPVAFMKKVHDACCDSGITWQQQYNNAGTIQYKGSLIKLFAHVDGKVYATADALCAILKQRLFEKKIVRQDTGVPNAIEVVAYTECKQKVAAGGGVKHKDIGQRSDAISAIEQNDQRCDDSLRSEQSYSLNSSLLQESDTDFNIYNANDHEIRILKEQLAKIQRESAAKNEIIKSLQKQVEDQKAQISRLQEIHSAAGQEREVNDADRSDEGQATTIDEQLRQQIALDLSQLIDEFKETAMKKIAQKLDE